MSALVEISSVCREMRTLMTRAEQLLRSIDGPDALAGVKPMDVIKSEIIVAAACKKFGVPERTIYSRDRHDKVARARQVCMVIIRAKMDLSYEDTGKIFRRDHGTALHAERSVRNLLDTDRKFAADYHALLSHIETQLNHETTPV